MKVVKTIAAGAHGSQKYLEEWGQQLLLVRYREDAEAGKLLTTLEIIVDERPKPKPGRRHTGFNAAQARELVALRVAGFETDLRAKVKNAGARWSPAQKLWVLSRHKATAIGVQHRIVPKMAEKCLDVDTSLIS